MHEMFTDLPPIDHDKFWDQYTIRYGASEENATPEGQREIYFTEALDDAFKIRELRAKKRLEDRQARELRWLVEALPAYLDETETFFGTANAEALRSLLKQHTGFEFNDNYELLEENEMARAKVKTGGESIDTSKMSDEEFKKTLDEVVPEQKDSTFRLPVDLFKDGGAIDEAVCPAEILNKMPVKTFSFAGGRYVLSSGAYDPNLDYMSFAEGWRIVPVVEFNGKPVDENNNVTGYHGVKVSVDGEEFVMLGPSVTFVPDVPDEEAEDDPEEDAGINLSITKEEFDRFNQAYSPSALTSDNDGAKRKPKPIESEIIYFEGKHYLIIGATYAMGGKYGEPQQSLSAHEVVPEASYEGETTLPSEWQIRGSGKHAGTKILGKDGGYWIVLDDDSIDMVQNEPSYFQDHEASEEGKTVYRVSIKALEALRETYSGETLVKGKIKKPFSLDGSLYVCDSFVNFTPDGTVSAFHATPAEEAENWREEYKQEKKAAGDFVEVKHGRTKYVLTGPAVEFRVFQSQLDELNETPAETTELPKHNTIDGDVNEFIHNLHSKGDPESEISNPRSRDVRSIPLDDIVVSDFEPQNRRRARFTDEEISDLAANIEANTLLQPILVRPVGDKFQIVFGECRYLAVRKLNQQAIDAEVRELSDEQAFDLQYAENSKRKNIHPIDEAYNFKCLQDRFQYDLDGISLHTGQKPAYVASRLKLTTLHPIVQQAFEEDSILFGHALEIGRYRKEDHPELLEYTFVEGGGKKGTISVQQLRDRIDEYYLRKLSKAPFSVKSEDLRDDKLKCVDCPERTSTKQTLFPDHSDEDRCLDPECWKGKVQRHVQIQRIKAGLGSFDPAKEYTKSEVKKVQDVVLVADGWVAKAEAPSEPYAEKYQLREVKTGECESAQVGVFFNGSKVGQKIHYCKDTSCKIHNRNARAESKEDPNERLRRKEELIDMHVSDLVRRKVFAVAARKFATYDSGSSELPGDFLARLVAKLWINSNSGEAAKTRTVVAEIFTEITGNTFSIQQYDLDMAAGKAAEEFTAEELNILLFLLVNGEQGHTYFDRYRSQAGVLDLADTYEIDYRLIDAEQRLAFAEERHKKHVDLYKTYLDRVRNGKPTKIPRPYFSDYVTPKD